MNGEEGKASEVEGRTDNTTDGGVMEGEKEERGTQIWLVSSFKRSTVMREREGPERIHAPLSGAN